VDAAAATIVLVILGMSDLLSLGILAGLGREELDFGVGVIFRTRDEAASGVFVTRRRRPGGMQCA
jgi:hypothetical protein